MADGKVNIVIPYIDEELDATTPRESALQILQHVRPEWNVDQIEVEKMTGGFANTMLCCYLVDDVNKSNALIVRIHGKSAYNSYLNRKAEIPSLAMGHHVGCNQPIHAIFKNGLVLGYAPGSALTFDKLFDQKIAREVSRTLAKLHSINVDDYHIVDSRGHEYEVDKTFILWTQWRNTVDELPENRFVEEIPTRQQFHQEISIIKKRIDEMNLPVVLCSVDMRMDNLIYDETTGTLQMVDLEGSSFGFALRDLAQALLRRDFFVAAGWFKDADVPDLDDNTIMSFVKPYVEYRYNNEDKDDSDITEEVLQDHFRMTKRFMAMQHFLCTVLCLMVSEEVWQTTFVYRKAAVACWGLYQEMKSDLFDGPGNKRCTLL